jgi:hypothetical protein
MVLLPPSKASTIMTTFRKVVLGLIGIGCLILLSIQIVANLASVHHDQNELLVDDPPDYPVIQQSIRLARSITDRNQTPTSFSKPLTSNDIFSYNIDHTKEIMPPEDIDLQEHARLQNDETSSIARTSSPFNSLPWSIETSFLYTLPQYGQIRRWGCRLSTVPFIFVHIGKTGGGNVRARLAASSLNYTKVEFRHQDFSYYPLRKRKYSSTQQRRRSKYDDEDRAQFCHTGYHMFKPQSRRANYRRSLQCNATTPLGQAMACPEIFHHAYDPNRTRLLHPYNPMEIVGNITNETIIRFHNRNALRYRRHPCFNPPSSDHAHVVFVGHHNLGSEMHWLPARLLSEWWNTYWTKAPTKESTIATTTNEKEQASSNAVDRVAQRLQSLQAYYDISNFPNHYDDIRDNVHDGSWCRGQPRPMFAYDDTAAFHESCSQELYQPMDELAKEAVQQRMSHIKVTTPNESTTMKITTTAASPDQVAMAGYWSTVYASLPVLRVTILRDPFSWLCSKFFWHRVDDLFNVTCDDAAVAIKGDWLSIRDKKQPNGWARRMALLYLEQICGDDCVVRSFYSTESVLGELERQATANLRQAFAVVGILPDLDDFYDLLNRRVDYLNTSLNQHVEGLRHGSFSILPEEAERCKNQYLKNRTFQELMLQAPEIAALQRVYEVGVEVNRFQRNELDQCSP